mgnify:CR=1 FL=1
MSFSEKLRFILEQHVMNLELYDNIDGVKFQDLTGEELNTFRNALIDANIKLICADMALGSDIKLTARALMTLGCRYLRLLLPANIAPEALRADIEKLSKICSCFGMTLLLENNADTLLSDDKSMTDCIFSSGAEAIFNPREYVRIKRHPFFHMYYWSKLKNRIAILRVNDALYSTGEYTPLACGNGEIKEMASIMLSRSFEGYFSFVARDESNVQSDIYDFKQLLKAM